MIHHVMRHVTSSVWKDRKIVTTSQSPGAMTVTDFPISDLILSLRSIHWISGKGHINVHTVRSVPWTSHIIIRSFIMPFVHKSPVHGNARRLPRIMDMDFSHRLGLPSLWQCSGMVVRSTQQLSSIIMT